MDTEPCPFLNLRLLPLHERQVPKELQRLIKSALPPNTVGVGTTKTVPKLIRAVYQALEFYPPTDEEALWGNSAIAEPDAEAAGRGLMNAISAAAKSVSLAQR